MVEKISVQIALTGTEEIKRQLAGVSQAGQKCFEDISSAAAKAGGFDKLDPTLVAQKFSQFGITATTEIKKINAALQSAAKLEGTVAGVQKLEQGFVGVSTAANTATAAFGLTRREIGALSRAARAIDLGPLGSQLALIGRVGGAFGATGIGLTAVAVAISGGIAALAKFAEGAQETQKALEGLQKVSGGSFSNLSALQQVFAAGGTDAKKFADEFTNLTEEVAGARQAKAIRNASKDWLEYNNNITTVRNQFDKLAQGGQILFSNFTTLDTKVQAVKESLAELKDPQAQWFKLADIMKNLSSDLDRAQIGKKLGLSPESIQSLALGSAPLKAMQNEVKQLGLDLNQLDSRDIRGLIESQTKLGALWDALKNKMGALASPAFTSFFQGLAEGLREVSPELQRIAQQFGQLDFSALGRSLAHVGAEITAWLGDIGDAIASGDFSTAFSRLVDKMLPAVTQAGTMLGQAFVSGMLSATSSAAEQLANALGTELQLLAQRFVFDLLKNFEILKANLKHLFTGETIEPPDTSKLDETWKKIRDDAYNSGKAVADTASNAGAALGQMGNAGTQAGKGIVDANTEAINTTEGLSQATQESEREFEQAEQAAMRAAQAWRQARAAFFDPMTRQFNIAAFDTANMAAGGLLGGRGSGTSDSNLAWVSRGEHIMPARAVAQPGVLALLETLRRSGGNLRGVLDGMGRFALGGMIRGPMPAFAGGGMVGGHLGTLTLGLPSGDSVSVRASTGVVDQLRKEAALAQVRSGGRKPSRYA